MDYVLSTFVQDNIDGVNHVLRQELMGSEPVKCEDLLHRLILARSFLKARLLSHMQASCTDPSASHNRVHALTRPNDWTEGALAFTCYVEKAIFYLMQEVKGALPPACGEYIDNATLKVRKFLGHAHRVNAQAEEIERIIGELQPHQV